LNICYYLEEPCVVLSSLRTNLKPYLCVQRKQNSSSSLRRRSSTFLDQGLPALVEARKEEAVEDVKWVVIATGRGGGDIWPGFVAAIDICGKNGDVYRGTLTVIRESTKGIDVPAGVIASGGTVCSCHWEGGQPHLQLVQAVFFETSQDMYVMQHGDVGSIHHLQTGMRYLFWIRPSIAWELRSGFGTFKYPG
jgi:hypothetical protein